MMVTRSAVLRIVRTINVDLACAGIGLVLSSTGVALLDLADIYGTDVKHVSQLVTTRGVGSLLGSFIGGRLYDRYNTQALTIAMMLLQAVSIPLLPLCGKLEIAHAAAAVSGIAMGAFDTGAHVWLINLWPANCGSTLQMYHFAFGVGAFVAPLITSPFLSVNGTTDHNATDTLDVDLRDFFQVASNPSQIANESTLSPIVNVTTDDHPSRIQYIFAIIAGVYVLLAVSMTVAYLIDKSDSKPQHVNNNERTSSCHCFTAVLLCLLGVYIMTVIGLECCYGQMLTTFAVESDLHFTKSSASYVTSVFFLTFSVARVMSAFWAAISSPLCILVSSQVVLLATHGMLVFLGDTSGIALWSATAFSGLAQAALYGTAVSWCVRYVTLSNSMMSVLIIAASVGSMAPPVLVGLFIENVPMVLMYVCFGATLLMAALLASMYVLTRNRAELTPPQEQRGNQCSAQCEQS